MFRFHERKMSELAEIDDSRDDETQFAAVSRLSDLGCEVYDMLLRPLVQASVSQPAAEAMRKMHPGRTSRRMFSDANPLMKAAQEQAEKAEKERAPADPANPFIALKNSGRTAWCRPSTSGATCATPPMS